MKEAHTQNEELTFEVSLLKRFTINELVMKTYESVVYMPYRNQSTFHAFKSPFFIEVPRVTGQTGLAIVVALNKTFSLSCYDFHILGITPEIISKNFEIQTSGNHLTL